MEETKEKFNTGVALSLLFFSILIGIGSIDLFFHIFMFQQYPGIKSENYYLNSIFSIKQLNNDYGKIIAYYCTDSINIADFLNYSNNLFFQLKNQSHGHGNCVIIREVNYYRLALRHHENP